MRPQPGEYAPYYETYISKITESYSPAQLFQTSECAEVFHQIKSQSKADFRYAPGKWSVKEMLVHMIDTERIMAYRALRIARGDKTPLPGFDQDLFMEHLDVSNRSLDSILAEYDITRMATKMLFNSFGTAELTRTGTASDNVVSVLALAYIIIGHERHHFGVLKDRYGLAF